MNELVPAATIVSSDSLPTIALQTNSVSISYCVYPSDTRIRERCHVSVAEGLGLQGCDAGGVLTFRSHLMSLSSRAKQSQL